MGCLFTHKWVRNVSNIRSVLPYRTCELCGTVQRGIYDPFWNEIAWETMRERGSIKLAQIKIVRQRAPRVDQLAHSLGLRRSRMSDMMGSRKSAPLA
jgi:hypothetical protein